VIFRFLTWYIGCQSWNGIWKIYRLISRYRLWSGCFMYLGFTKVSKRWTFNVQIFKNTLIQCGLRLPTSKYYDYVVSSHCEHNKIDFFFFLSARYKITYGENSNVPDDLSRQYIYALKSSRQCFFSFLKTFNAQAVTAFPSSRQRRGSFSSILHNENS